MSTMMPRLVFDATGALMLERADGGRFPVVHSAGPLGTLDGTRLLLGGGVVPATGDMGPRVFVDLVDLAQPATVARYVVAGDGRCGHSHELELAAYPATDAYLLNPQFVAAARQRLNDCQIHAFLRLAAGDVVAAAYLDGLAADHGPDGAAGCRLVVLFNHHYARNCRPIHDFYRRRFPDVDFVMPCVAPRHPRYFAYPFGSYQFHGLVHGYLRDRLQIDSTGPQAYLFIQDDVLLHPRLSAGTVLDLLSGEHGGMFPVNHPYSLEAVAWPWTARVANSLRKPMDPLVGNGFEGLTPAVSLQRLHHGVSDCFALRADLVPAFLDQLGPLVAANVFPEVAIPTSLFTAVRMAGLSVAVQPGRFLWGADRDKVRDPAFIAEFLASDAAFVHPLKIATGDEAILRLLRDAEACAG